VQASHLTPLAEKAGCGAAHAASLYERGRHDRHDLRQAEDHLPVQDPEGAAKDGADIAAELSLVLSKTNGFTVKDVTAAAKKIKAAKVAPAAFKPVAAKAGKAAAQSTSDLLAALNAGMLAQSAGPRRCSLTSPVAVQR